MPRKGSRDLAKEHHWRGVLKDWQASAVNGAEYCRRHAINYTQFKDWQKIIRRRDAEPSSTSRKSGWPKGKPRKKKVAQIPDSSSAASLGAGFVSVKLKDSAPVATPPSSSADMEIILRCGTILRITSLCQPSFVSSMVTALEER